MKGKLPVMILSGIMALGLIFFLVTGIRFGRLTCNRFIYIGKNLKCGQVFSTKEGVSPYLVRIDLVKYKDKSFEIEYSYNFSTNTFFLKNFYLKGRAYFSEATQPLIGVVIKKTAVVEFLPDNEVINKLLSVEQFRALLDEKFKGNIGGREVVLLLKPPFKESILMKDRKNDLIRITFEDSNE